jgi:hypothetical protein
MLASLIESCKLHGVNPEAYLTDAAYYGWRRLVALHLVWGNGRAWCALAVFFGPSWLVCSSTRSP